MRPATIAALACALLSLTSAATAAKKKTLNVPTRRCQAKLDYTFAFNARPERGCLYSVAFTRPLQKVKGGYLVCFSSPGPDEGCTSPWFFLSTKKMFARGQLLLSGDAYYDGTYTYQSLDGFDQTIYKFTLATTPPATTTTPPATMRDLDAEAKKRLDEWRAGDTTP